MCVGSPTLPELTFSEVLFGKSKKHQITAVALPIGEVTPEIEASLHSLTELELLFVEMPGMVAHTESAEVKRLNELKETFGDRVWPTANLEL